MHTFDPHRGAGYHLATPAEQRAIAHGKWQCPSCGRKTFVCYVDAGGRVLDERVGKCDRADKCAYHYPPRMFFAEHYLATRPTPPPPPPRALPQPSHIPFDLFKASLRQYENNHLVTFLLSLFGETRVSQLIADYYIGTARHWPGSTVFWQVDRRGLVHGGKIMQYDPDTGKRVKTPTSRITWVHSALQLPDYHLKQCLFGEHLLARRPTDTVLLVESEKTAIITSAIVGDCITLACGGCGNLTASMCAPLLGRDVVLLPDNGMLDNWRQRALQLRHIFARLRIAHIMEHQVQNPGDDFADYVQRISYEHPADWATRINFELEDLV